MAYITALESFPNFNDYKDQGKLAYAGAVRTWLASLLTFQTQANAQRDEVNDLKDETKAIRDEAVVLKDNYFEPIIENSAQTLQYRNDALAVKASIESYVVPTEATYSAEEIDAKVANVNLENFLGFNL